MKSENLISWSLPNFVTFAFMVAILWIIIGTAGHLLIRQPAARRVAQTATVTP